MSNNSVDTLSSEVGIDYSKLRDLLANLKWKEADLETKDIMYQVAHRDKGDCLTLKDLEEFPCTDLNTINNLWLKYSNRHFGFSIQKHIWQGLAATEGAGDETERRFGDLLGWRLHDSWLSYDELDFSLDTPWGHLPVCGYFWFPKWEKWWVSALTAKLAACDIP